MASKEKLEATNAQRSSGDPPPAAGQVKDGGLGGLDGGSMGGPPKPIEVEQGMLGFFAAGGEERAIPLKVVGYKDVELSPEDIITPPDGGWGWFIVFIAFLSNVFVDGTIFAFALIQQEIYDKYKVNGKENDPEKAGVAWAGSLILGFNFLSGPLTSVAADKFGFRAVSMFGSFLAGFSFVIVGVSSHVDTGLPRLPFMYVFYGVIAGIATGMIYMPSVICVGYYFDKNRALAVGLAISGTGCGTFIMALLTKYLIEQIDWQGAIIVQGCILFGCSMIGALYRPLESDYYGDDCFKTLTKMSNRMRVAMAEMYRRRPGVGTTDVLSRTGSSGTLKVGDKGSGFSLRKRFINVDDIVKSGLPPRTTSARNLIRVGTETNGQGRSAISYNFPTGAFSQESNIDAEGGTDPGFEIAFEGADGDVPVVKVPTDMNRPTARPEAYIGGSTNVRDQDGVKYVYTIPKGKHKPTGDETASELRRRFSSSKHTGIGSQLSGSGGDQPEPEQVKEPAKKPTCMERFCKKLRSIRITSMPAFWLIAINGFLMTLGYPVPYIYLSELAMANGVGQDIAPYLLSFMGMANTIGRIVCGYFSDSPKVNSLYVNNISGILAGAVTFVLPFLTFGSSSLYIPYALVFGGSMACFATLRSILIRDYIGLSVLTQAFGLCLSFQGVAAIASSPMAAGMRAATGDFKLAFMTSGVLIIVASSITFFLPLAYKKQMAWDAQREAEAEAQQN